MKKIKKHYLIYLSILLFLVVSTIIISAFGWDIKLEKYFYDQNSTQPWFQKEAPLFYFLYHYGTIPAVLVSATAFILFLLSWSINRFKKFRLYYMLILLTLIIGPGIIINATLKDRWGRPRPRQVQELGGKWEFHETWEPGIPGKGKSFPCGHCAMGFIFIVLYFSFRKKQPRLAYASLSFSLLYGSLIGLARIAQGGHFLSDVIWSGGITYFIAAFLYYDILKIPEKSEKEIDKETSIPEKTKTSPAKLFWIIFSIILSIAIFLFIFLFSKPVYKEYQNRIKSDKKYRVACLNLNIEQANLTISPSENNVPLKLKATLQGFGYAKSRFINKLEKFIRNDTMYIDYLCRKKGYFYESEVEVNVMLDTSKITIVSGKINDGNIYLKNISTKISTKPTMLNNGKLITVE